MPKINSKGVEIATRPVPTMQDVYSRRATLDKYMDTESSYILSWASFMRDQGVLHFVVKNAPPHVLSDLDVYVDNFNTYDFYDELWSLYTRKLSQEQYVEKQRIKNLEELAAQEGVEIAEEEPVE